MFERFKLCDGLLLSVEDLLLEDWALRQSQVELGPQP